MENCATTETDSQMHTKRFNLTTGNDTKKISGPILSLSIGPPYNQDIIND